MTFADQCKLVCVVLSGVGFLAAGCKKSSPSSTTPPSVESTPVPTLLLAKAQFKTSLDASAGDLPVPGPGLVSVLQRINGTWIEGSLTDPHCKVFHKAQVVDAASIHGRILTISGTEARLCAWERNGASWVSEVIWNPTFGGRFDRLRDFEVGDVDHDGIEDIVVGTHDQGVVAMASHVRDQWTVREIDKSPNTFVHEIELGDTDGDGQLEVFATPSRPNQATLASQPGLIVQYKITRENVFKRTVANLQDTHCKEIMTADLDRDGKDELVAAIEARTEVLGGKVEIVEPVQIVLFRDAGGTFDAETIAEIPDRLCRVLCAGDIDGDARSDIVLTGMDSGIWWLRPMDNGTWKLDSIDRRSSGFEHAATLYDFDGSGRDNIYVASEREGELREYAWTGSEFTSKVIAKLPDNQLTFSITGCTMRPVK